MTINGLSMIVLNVILDGSTMTMMTKETEKIASGKLISVSELFRKTIDYYRVHWKLLVGIQAIPAAIGVFQLVNGSISQNVFSNVFYSFIGVIAYAFAWPALLWVVVKDDKLSTKDAYKKGLTLLLPLFFVSFLRTIFIFIGFLLFVIPGIYLSISLSFVQYVLFDQNLRGREALRASRYYVKSNWWGTLVRILVFGLAIGIVQIVLWILSVGPEFESLQNAVMSGESIEQNISIFDGLGVLFGTLFAAPIGVTYSYFLYKSLKENKEPYSSSKVSEAV